MDKRHLSPSGHPPYLFAIVGITRIMEEKFLKVHVKYRFCILYLFNLKKQVGRCCSDVQ